MPRVILFGYEGGLADLARRRLRILTGVLAEEGVELSPAVLAAHPLAPPYEDWFGGVLRGEWGEVAASLPARLMARAAARYRDSVRDDGPDWLPGAVELVRRAAAAGYDLGVVATVPRRELDQALGRTALGGCFRVVVSGEDVDSAGLDASLYLAAMIRLNSQPPLPERLIHAHEVVAIEGTPERVRAAAAAGLFTIAIGGDPEALTGADVRVDGYAELDLSGLGSG